MSYDPKPVWALGSEAALDEIRTGIRLTCRPRGDRLTAAPNPFHAGELHQAGDLVPADLPPGAGHRVVHLSDAVDAVAYVEVMNPHCVARRVRQMASTPN